MSRIVRSVFTMISIFTCLVISLTGCTDKKNTPTNRVVNLAIWGNYLSTEMQEKFSKDTGIELRVTNYSSNEELLAKIQAGASGIDVAVPSDYMVNIMAKMGLLEPLDSSKLTNKTGLDPAFLKQDFDPENKYSLPYAWSTAGIAINKDLFKGSIKGWKDLFENKELSGKISLLDDVRETTAAALKLNHYSVNTTKKEELKTAEESLKKVRNHIKMFRSDMVDPLVNKEVAAAHVYSGEALKASQMSGGKIEYILPEEGGTRAIDNLVILKSAKNIDEAHQLINFFLTPEANVAFVKEIMSGPVVLKTREMLPEDLRTNTSLFPPQEVLSKFEAIRDLGDDTQLYDRIWTKIKVE